MLALKNDNGSVIHWWSHERTVLKQIRGQLELSSDVEDKHILINFIDSLLGTQETSGRLVDLGKDIVMPLLFLPGTKGSSSIKKVLPALLGLSTDLQEKYSKPIYGGADSEITSLNFQSQIWVRKDKNGKVADPYTLLSKRFNDPDLDTLDEEEEENSIVADGGAAMVAYGLLQQNILSADDRSSLEEQLLRYCELDTLAMVMAWEGLNEIVSRNPV